MLGQLPDLTPEGDDAAYGQPRFAWVEGSAEAGPVPAEAPGGSVGPDGLDYEALLDALADSGRLADPDADQDAVLADELAAAADGRMSPPDLAWTAAIAVEHMTPGRRRRLGWRSPLRRRGGWMRTRWPGSRSPPRRPPPARTPPG